MTNREILTTIFEQTMSAKTISMKMVGNDMRIAKDNGAMLLVSPFTVEEFSDDDITTDWLRAERYITINLCDTLYCEYTEVVTIDCTDGYLETNIETVELSTDGNFHWYE